jgi:hypothetical protein
MLHMARYLREGVEVCEGGGGGDSGTGDDSAGGWDGGRGCDSSTSDVVWDTGGDGGVGGVGVVGEDDGIGGGCAAG